MPARLSLIMLSAWLAASLVTGCGSSPAGTTTPAAAGSTGYDAALAERLGADEYGMAKYVVAFLRAGPRADQSPEEAKELMKAHLANINRMADEGTLVVAGPFLDDGPLRGIYIFRVETVEEARALTATDPAVQAGRLVMELHPWYGSAALREVTPLQRRLERKDIKDIMD